MNKETVFHSDIRSRKTTPGAYEWWYFDAVSDDGATEFVIIFYEGNPFSRRYIKNQYNGSPARPSNHPAISISIYQDDKPVYYSFTETKESAASFDDQFPSMQIDDHSMQGSLHGDDVIYQLQLNEKLPSGDKIKAELEFRGPLLGAESFGPAQNKNHAWDLIQPRADVTGRIQYSSRTQTENIIDFKGQGYHDHNKGNEPLKNQFDDWYWGRFHFKNHSLVYYLMDHNKEDAFAWIISKDGLKVLEVLDTVQLQDFARTIYGMRSARKLTFSNGHAQVLIQQTKMLDSGPFYQRFSSHAFVDGSSSQPMTSRGITEYLCPPRIYNRWYWPLTNMRIRYKQESPHWVQRSKRLYRWTW